MIVMLTDEEISDYIATQAKVQHTTPDKLIEKLCRRCMDLSLIESLATTQGSEEWANEPL